MPDPASPLFRQIAIGAHPSVLHLTRPANEKTKGFKTVVTVDEIRRVNRFLSMTSHDGSYRVVIVDPADDMNTNAANALLKNLEEPPARTVFILIAHSPGSLLPTIRSRCQMVRLHAARRRRACSPCWSASNRRRRPMPAARQALAERAGGSARKAILLTQYGGLEIAEATRRAGRGGADSTSPAHRLADAVAGRDQAIQFDIFNAHALELSRRRRQRGGTGRRSRSAPSRCSDCWQEVADCDRRDRDLQSRPQTTRA